MEDSVCINAEVLLFCFKQETKKWRKIKMRKNYFLFVNGKKVEVSEEIYKVYWQEKNHEKYLKQVDRKNHLLFFSSFDHDGHFEDSIVDEGFDVDKIVQTQMMIEAVRDALSKLNDKSLIDFILMMKHFVQ